MVSESEEGVHRTGKPFRVIAFKRDCSLESTGMFFFKKI